MYYDFTQVSKLDKFNILYMYIHHAYYLKALNKTNRN